MFNEVGDYIYHIQGAQSDKSLLIINSLTKAYFHNSNQFSEAKAMQTKELITKIAY